MAVSRSSATGGVKRSTAGNDAVESLRAMQAAHKKSKVSAVVYVAEADRLQMTWRVYTAKSGKHLNLQAPESEKGPWHYLQRIPDALRGTAPYHETHTWTCLTCWAALKVQEGKKHPFAPNSFVALKHWKNDCPHPPTFPSLQKSIADADVKCEARMAVSQQECQNMGDKQRGIAPPPNRLFDSQMVSHTATAGWITGGGTYVAKRTLLCPLFRRHLEAAFEHGRATANNPNARYKHLSTDGLAHFVRSQMILLKAYVRLLRDETSKAMGGNPSAQGQLDHVKLGDKLSYMSGGSQLVDPRFFKCWMVAFCFKMVMSKTAANSARDVDEACIDFWNVNFTTLHHTLITDGACLTIATLLGLCSEQCEMHEVDKGGKSAVGHLTKSRGGVLINPFEAGVDFVKRALAVAKYFNAGNNLNKLHAVEVEGGNPKITFKVPATSRNLATPPSINSFRPSFLPSTSSHF